MESVNDYSIIENSSNELMYESTYESKESKSGNLRANVFLSFAVIGTMSLTQVNATSYNILQNSQEIQNISLQCTEEVIDEISSYSSKLSKRSYFDKFQIIESILSFKSLENSWDGYNAVPTGIKCATNALKIVDALDLGSLEKISDIYPNPNGTITIEWENNYNEIVSLEIGKETFTYYVEFTSFGTKFFNKQAITFENTKMLKKYISAI